MKRYVVEMANDFERRFPSKATEIRKIKSQYIAQCIREIDAVKALIEIIDHISPI